MFELLVCYNPLAVGSHFVRAAQSSTLGNLWGSGLSQRCTRKCRLPQRAPKHTHTHMHTHHAPSKAARAPEITLVKVLTALARYGQFASAASAARVFMLAESPVCKGCRRPRGMCVENAGDARVAAHASRQPKPMPARDERAGEVVRRGDDGGDARSRHFAPRWCRRRLRSSARRATFRHRLHAAQHAERRTRVRPRAAGCTTGVDRRSTDEVRLAAVVVAGP